MSLFCSELSQRLFIANSKSQILAIVYRVHVTCPHAVGPTSSALSELDSPITPSRSVGVQPTDLPAAPRFASILTVPAPWSLQG